MSKVICIAGESGSGKTTSMRNLDPKTTLYIDCDKKGLSWKGWKQQYNTENKNYIKTDFVQQVLIALKKLETDWKDKKVVVIDTLNGLMIADEMRRSKEKGYDKWVDLAACVWDLVCYAYELRDDLTVIFQPIPRQTMTKQAICLLALKHPGRSWTRLCWKVSLLRYFCQSVWMGNTFLRPRRRIARPRVP